MPIKASLSPLVRFCSLHALSAFARSNRPLLLFPRQYPLIWCPKRRKKLGETEVREWVAETMRRAWAKYDIEIEELAVEEDHVHVFASFPPRYSLARVVGVLKSASASRAFRRFPWL